MKSSQHLHPLEEYLQIQQTHILGFAQSHPDIWQLFSTCFNVSNMLMIAIGHQPNLSIIETYRLVLWQSVLHYQSQALVLILNHHLDAGYALLRLAAELSRDIYCVGDDENLLNLWKDKENRRREYQDRFKFDNKSPIGRTVFDTYKLCSKYGVHGHITNSIFSEPIGFVDKEEKILLLDISELGILDAIHIWLTAFVPIQSLCVNTFFESHKSHFYEEFGIFTQFGITMAETLKDLRKVIEMIREDDKVH
jgi:hypothetical protein